ncbi:MULTISPECIES: MFS transporter [Thioclava]|uniref:MFS transporter n=1 Tax=Thioclava kandeliae TaxID=3070818 RepID=A0ABV1SMD7_9RHOB
MDTTTNIEVEAPAPTSANSRKSAVAAWIGSALEYYDFFIYGSAAALVFNHIIFASDDPALATILSLATFAIAYIARPLGSFMMGYIGDVFGRKTVMLLTLMGMGVCTFLIGLLPTYEQVGGWAPVALVFLRLCQGLAVAGEGAGASSMTLEHAPHGRRAFFSSSTMAGTQAGQVLAVAVFLPISALPEEALFSWGWRVPFLLSVVVMAIAWWIRRAVPEPEVFEDRQTGSGKTENPLRVLIRLGYLPDVLKVLFAAFASITSTLSAIYGLNFAVQTMGVERSTMLWVIVLANIVAIVAIPLWARLADRIGRRPVFILGTLGSAALIWPFLWSIAQRDVPMIFASGILMSGVIYAAYSGSAYAMFSEQFETRVRMSGTAIGTQFGFALGGFAPTIATMLAGPHLDNWVPVAIMASVTGLIATVATLLMRETHALEIQELGRLPR